MFALIIFDEKQINIQYCFNKVTPKFPKRLKESDPDNLSKVSNAFNIPAQALRDIVLEEIIKKH